MKQQNGFSLRGLLTLVTVIAIGLALPLPAIQRAREDARRMSCSGHLKQLAVAVHNYHSAFKQMPSLMSGTEQNNHQLSGWVALLPFMGQQRLWDEISDPNFRFQPSFPPMGPPPSDATFPPWQFEAGSIPPLSINSFLSCPSELEPTGTPYQPTNYAFSVGDQITGLYQNTGSGSVRGPFAPQLFLRFSDILDGLSNTILMGEITNSIDDHVSGNTAIGSGNRLKKDPSSCLQALFPGYINAFADGVAVSKFGRGYNYADGAGGYGWITTILPPNSPSCAIQSTPLYEGVFSVASRHPGGAHIMLSDGAVIFITDTIDCGDPSQPPPSGLNFASPYGIWGALGARAAEEDLTEQTID